MENTLRNGENYDANVLENYKEIAGQNVGAALVVVGRWS